LTNHYYYGILQKHPEQDRKNTEKLYEIHFYLGDKQMIITTTPQIEGKRIAEYKGIVFGEVINGVNFVKDFAAGLTSFFGGRSGSYEGELIQAREDAIKEMRQRAVELGANAIVGVDIDYEVLGKDGNMLMVTASGTAVTAE
jgi:uncharacterized protein YbjQ (UPF0145 family)